MDKCYSLFDCVLFSLRACCLTAARQKVRRRAPSQLKSVPAADLQSFRVGQDTLIAMLLSSFGSRGDREIWLNIVNEMISRGILVNENAELENVRPLLRVGPHVTLSEESLAKEKVCGNRRVNISRTKKRGKDKKEHQISKKLKKLRQIERKVRR
jgi:hypothetical protein